MPKEQDQTKESKPDEAETPEVVQDSDSELTVVSSDIPDKAPGAAPKEKEVVGSDLEMFAEEPPEEDTQTDQAGNDDKPDAKSDDAEKLTPEDIAAKDAEEFSKLPKSVRARLARSKRQRDEAKAEAEAMRIELEELKAEKAEDDKKRDDENLTADDFDTFDEFLEWRDGKDKSEEKPKKAEAPKDVDGVPVKEFTSALGDLKESVNTEDPQLWDKATKSDLDFSGPLVVALNETDNPTEVLRAIVSDPSRAAKLSAMSPFKQARELAKIESDVSSAPTQKVTSAPAPAEVGGTRGLIKDKTYEDMSQAEFEKKRAEEEGGFGNFWL